MQYQYSVHNPCLSVITVIPKAAFLSAVDLINSTLLKNSKNASNSIQLPFFANEETEKLALLSPNTRKSRLQSLMSMLSEQAMCASTDDDLLDDEGTEQTSEQQHQSNPPPIPPRAKSIPSLMLSDVRRKGPKRSTASSTGRSPPLPPKAVRSPQLKTVSESSLDFSTSFSTNASSSIRNSRGECSILNPPQSPRSNRTSSGSSVRRISTPSPERLYPYDENYFAISRVESDSDSSDFEPFVPPKRSRYASEPFVHQHVFECQNERLRRVSSPLPELNKQLKKSSPILTKRPGWYSKPDRKMMAAKHQSEASLTLGNQVVRKTEIERTVLSERFKYRSRSVDSKVSLVTSQTRSTSSKPVSQGQYATLYDSDDYTGSTMDSRDYSKPFEHILWRKLGLDDGSAISGSLPGLDRICTAGSDIRDDDNEDEDDDPEGCTYLDPTELEEYCERLGNRELSDRIRKRLSTVLSGTYLSLMNVQGAEGGMPGSESEPKSSLSRSIKAEAPARRNDSPSLSLERFKKSGLADSISCSGYSTDASSGFDNDMDSAGFLGRVHSMRIENPYGDLQSSLGQVACSENVDRAPSESREQDGGTREGEGEDEEEQIYEEIDQYSDMELRTSATPAVTAEVSVSVQKAQSLTLPARHPPLHLSQSVPPDTDSFSWHKKAGRSTPHESPYATLKEITGQPRGFRRAPTLPPRRIKKVASLDPTQGRRKHYFRNEPKVPGVRLSNKIIITRPPLGSEG